ncbi:MAG: D-isomer specific 2-hydroxyacid dehydrogenase [Parcubacteria group bacterium Athens0714_24]|nr:MAG: D-isomer specific 2-hydroxyacid dehydrogenase [Parcubacteria group bacterium Athens0714_24]
MLQEKGFEVDVSEKDGVLTKEELISNLKAKPYDAVLCLLTDKIDAEVFDAVPTAKIFANYAVGIDNIDLKAAAERGITITNTPGVLTESVAEQAIALLFAIARRVVEADQFMRDGKYVGWQPMLFLGNDLVGKTLGLVGLGRIGAAVAKRMHDGFEMKIIYYDLKRNEELEKQYHLEYKNLEDLLKESDFVSVHVPLTPETKHLIGDAQLKMIKKTAYLVNTSRGPVIDENALVQALKDNEIKGAALDVYEEEPKMAEGLKDLPNVVLTPHIASATEETRGAMSELAAKNIIEFLGGKTPANVVKMN